MRQKWSSWRSAMINKGWGYKSHKTKDHHTIVAKEDTKKKHLTNLSLHHILWPFILFLSFYSFSATTTTTKLLQVPLITGMTHSYSVYIPLSVFHSFMGVFHLFFFFFGSCQFHLTDSFPSLLHEIFVMAIFCHFATIFICIAYHDFFCHTYRHFLNC